MPTLAEVDAIRARHQEAVWERYETRPPTLVRTGECVTDDQPWPCDTARETARADAAEQDAARLAEALDRLVDASAVVIAEDEDPAYLQPYRRRGQEALRLHAERTQRPEEGR